MTGEQIQYYVGMFILTPVAFIYMIWYFCKEIKDDSENEDKSNDPFPQLKVGYNYGYV